MEKFVGTVNGEEITMEECNLLSVALDALRGELSRQSSYRSKIESEFSNIFDGILKLVDSKLIGSASNDDFKDFHLKMKCDYHRYLEPSARTPHRILCADAIG